MNDLRREALLGPVRAMQIIVVALAMGIILFAGIVVGVVVGPAQMQPQAGFMTGLALPLAAVAIGLSFLVPRIVVNASRRRIAAGTWQVPSQGSAMPEALAKLGDEGPLVFVYQTATIIGAALCEGPAFFALISAMIDKSPLGLAVAGVCLLMVLARFPTLRRVENWLDLQVRAMEEDRMLMR
jgi:hypothetical protein